MSEFEEKLFLGKGGIILGIVNVRRRRSTLIVFYCHSASCKLRCKRPKATAGRPLDMPANKLEPCNLKSGPSRRQCGKIKDLTLMLFWAVSDQNKQFGIKMTNNVLHLPLKMTVLGKTPAKSCSWKIVFGTRED